MMDRLICGYRRVVEEDLRGGFIVVCLLIIRGKYLFLVRGVFCWTINDSGI